MNVFGQATDCDSGADTDLINGANSTDGIKTWVAPTQARIHNIKSTSTDDDGSPAGIGAHKVRIYGLVSWVQSEITEDVILNGTTDVATTRAYVIIYDMRVLQWGSSGPNVGKITATAQTDATVTAQINANVGNTHMALLGIAKGDELSIANYYASIVKNAAIVRAKLKLLVNTIPNSQLTKFIEEHAFGLDTSASQENARNFTPSKLIEGPAIVKIAINTDTDNSHVVGGFDVTLMLKRSMPYYKQIAGSGHTFPYTVMEEDGRTPKDMSSFTTSKQLIFYNPKTKEKLTKPASFESDGKDGRYVITWSTTDFNTVDDIGEWRVNSLSNNGSGIIYADHPQQIVVEDLVGK